MHDAAEHSVFRHDNEDIIFSQRENVYNGDHMVKIGRLRDGSEVL